MRPFVVKDKSIPVGKIILPGDKSIAHRALIISALSTGKTTIRNFPIHDDSLATLNALAALGVKILRKNTQILVWGRPGRKLLEPRKPIFVNNSGTTLRLLLGVLAGQNFETKLIAGKYLSLRPMSRVNLPLRMMGARITARIKGAQEYPPIIIRGNKLKGISYRLPVASAQVKSAILLAGLFAKGKTRVIEPVNTRDHTERMLKLYGVKITKNKNSIILNPGKDLASPGKIYIPGDISSAAFFIVLGAIIPGARITIEAVSLNPGRCGVINVLRRMQAKIKVFPLKCKKAQGFEPMGNLRISSSRLKSTVVNPGEVPSLIDELPVLMVAACFAQGRTIIKSAGELRAKETDRINSMVTDLKRMGADIRVNKSGRGENIVIQGQGRLKGAKLKSFADHRTAMSMVIAALAAEGASRIDDVSCISKSFPGFLAMLNSLKNKGDGSHFQK